jgi:archaeal cell division control protein 6
MGYDFLSSDQTLFSNPDALDPDFLPKKLPHREGQQDYIATAIKPLFQERNGKNILIHGTPGIGKTASTKRVLRDLDDFESDKKIGVVLLNCWKLNTTYKVICEIAHQLGFPFTQNLKTNEVMDKIRNTLGKFDGVVFAFDEIDKADDYDFLYFVLEEFPRKTLILITNEQHWGAELDDRIRSRLVPESIEFKSYTTREVFDILQERKKYAFYDSTWADSAFELLSDKASQYQDIRVGIKLLKVAGETAENDSSKRVEDKHIIEAINSIGDFKIKSSADLTDEEKHILSICSRNSGKHLGIVFNSYKMSGGAKSLKTFKRKLERLQGKKLISLEETGSGFRGQSTIIRYIGLYKKQKIDIEKSKVKGLDEF